jgi:hypothetical protein
MMKKKRKLGSEFEEAVFRFAKTLDPQAEILFDHFIPDRDTDEPRQCDVWINAKFGGHWPLSILISCKDHKRKLHSGDIGTFCDEVRSTRANVGVIYSRSGFSKPALQKAQVNGYSCCRIFQNEPADLPHSIYFEQFACYPQVRLEITTNNQIGVLKTWNDVFSLKTGINTVLDIIESTFNDNEEKSVKETFGTGAFPLDWIYELEILPDGLFQPIKLKIFGHWKKYRARIEATLLNGSYCLNDNSFQGTIFGPSIDTCGEHPGDAWKEIIDIDFTLPENRIVAVLYRGKVKDALKEKLGPLPMYQ